ncbi:RNA polymerase sigma factor [Paenibacillus provencensis]|uniref:RNA polymerase sigma factor n=1 Tax=Paenibacillus provencensis TaxID=441151 RepID=A0ABW3PIF8_9BACL|nr:sigma-70 family RNA polymerase sigma factor [Paenibacillus sp. MER 78]MCM3126747.1 sigma-70 family RNA polymerase sigma factor [Paenibacillus sp. MER 78]
MDVAKEVKKAQRGNLRSFEHLISAHKVTMYQVARTLLASDADCADAIQEAILKAFSKLKSLREPSYFKTWLLRIVINECNQIHRRNKNVIDFNELTFPSTSEKGYERVELEQLLATLPEEDRRLLKLYHIEDISIKDLADIYEKPENTIKTWLRRARENARSLWGEQEELEWKNGSRKS